MTNPVLLMLIERLLWPVPRVRWEVARSLAGLIREQDKVASQALLDWIHSRSLESEVVLGLGVIDAFDLGTYFEYVDVSRTIRAPSLLSDFLLRRNFPDATDLSPMLYARSPSKPPTLLNHVKDWFDRYRKTAVPLLFSSDLTWLEESTGFPFMQGWQYEWRWLQATNPRPCVEHPSFFTTMNRNRVDHFNCGQRELYVSAYLRTLGFAVNTEAISQEVAERYAMNALTMNRGLAELEPIERPDWAKNLLPCDARRAKELAQKLWARAESATRPDEMLLALRVVDFEEDGFIEFDIALAIGATGFAKGPTEAETFSDIMVNESPDDMAGLVGREAGSRPLSMERPLFMTQRIIPKALVLQPHIDKIGFLRR